MTGSTHIHLTSPSQTSTAYFDHSSGQRTNTDAVIVSSLRSEYPTHHLTVAPLTTCNLLAYASSPSTPAFCAPIDTAQDRLSWFSYLPALRRLDGETGSLQEDVKFGKYLYECSGREFVVVVANGRDGLSAFPSVTNQYILSRSVDATNKLLLDVGRWTNELHDEVWVFDGGRWGKSRELWDSIARSEWADVILEEAMKEAIRSDVGGFFDARETYARLRVPWKRGVIFYGPPGNGKTISVKAMMHELYRRKDPVPTLYVRSLAR